MPKSLQKPPPSSAVMRLFDGTAAANALAAPDVDQTPPAKSTPVVDLRRTGSIASNRPTEKRDLVLTEATASTLDRLVSLYRRTTRTRLTRSHVMRAVLIAIDHAFGTIEHEATSVGALKLPSNAGEHAVEREQFEQRLAASVVAGIRAAALMTSVR